jgi:hypothetical protein
MNIKDIKTQAAAIPKEFSVMPPYALSLTFLNVLGALTE